MKKGIGPRGLGAPKSAAKMMKSPNKMAMKSPNKMAMKSPVEMAMKSPAKKDEAKSNKEKAAMAAEKRTAGKDSDSIRRGLKAKEFKKAGGAKLSQGQPGYKEAISKAEAAAEKRMRRINPSNM